MGIKQNESKKGQVENLKSILKEFGITTPQELDDALSDALAALTIGIMTEQPVKVENTAY